jgi:predicted amidohydrolase
LAQAGAEVLTVPSAFTRITGEAHWHVLLRARAIETGSFILAPAQAGLHECGRETFGMSLAVSPWGEVIAEGGKEPQVVMAGIDRREAQDARRRIPVLWPDNPVTLNAQGEVAT